VPTRLLHTGRDRYNRSPRYAPYRQARHLAPALASRSSRREHDDYEACGHPANELRHRTQVVDVRIIMDRNTRRSKGFAYIEMATRESIIPALSLAGQTLMGQSVMVKSSEARPAMQTCCFPGCCSKASMGGSACVVVAPMRFRVSQLTGPASHPIRVTLGVQAWRCLCSFLQSRQPDYLCGRAWSFFWLDWRCPCRWLRSFTL